MPRSLLLVLLLTPPLLTACGGGVQRTISVTSQPTGALVHLNDEEVGRTPVTIPFTWYGTYDVRVQKEGYLPLWTQARAKPPWWETPGLDLLAEAVPGARSEVEWHFDLEPRPEPTDADADALLDRARAMRHRVEQ